MDDVAVRFQLFSIAGLGGVLVISVGISFIFYGITATQTYIYHTANHNDRFFTQAIVAAVWVLETVHTILLLRSVYFYAITTSGNYLKVLEIDWSVAYVVFSEIHIIVLVEGYNIQRIWTLSRGCAPIVGVLSSDAAYIVEFHCETRTWDWLTYNENPLYTLLINISAGTAAGFDGMVAGTMVYYLLRSRTGVKRTNGIIRWLMAYFVQSGVIMVFVSVAIAIFHAYLPLSLGYTGLTTVKCKLYANSFLGTLNARRFMRDRANRTSTSLWQTRPAPPTNTSRQQPTSPDIPLEPIGRA
ncbi:hypothetical protein K474DRAFT_1710664 [Panus rudis PR-1116 ss-1]|nr:hypothetical protein K474DRAFT_1710664 [Panus rudis PR-1116 ss-1]